MLKKSIHLAYGNINLSLESHLGRCTNITTDEYEDFLLINVTEPLITQEKLTLPGSTAAEIRKAQPPLTNGLGWMWEKCQVQRYTTNSKDTLWSSVRGNKPCLIQDFPTMQSSSSPKTKHLAVPALSPYTRQGFSHAKLAPCSCMHFTHCSQDTDLAHKIVALKPTRNKNQSQNLLLRRQRALGIM